MRYRRNDVVTRAIDVLDVAGLSGLSMRRLAADLGLQPGALYHHFTNKDALLAAMATEILNRGRRPSEIMAWDAELQLLCLGLRDAIRRHRDGALLIAQVHRSDALSLEAAFRDALERAGAERPLAPVGARTLVRYVLAHEGDDDADFTLGLELLLDGLRTRLG